MSYSTPVTVYPVEPYTPTQRKLPAYQAESSFDEVLSSSLESQTESTSSTYNSIETEEFTSYSATSPLLRAGDASATSSTSSSQSSSGWLSYLHYGLSYDASTQTSSGGQVSGSEPVYMRYRAKYGYGLPDGGFPLNPVDGVGEFADGEYEYQLVKVGEIDRAPMAMFEHDGELVLSAITRNEISSTPVWTYTDEDGVVLRSNLPDECESGHYGFSYGDGFHLIPESYEGMVDYTASSPDGPWTKNDYSDLCPHDYDNLKWGFGYEDPATGGQFMGFGNADHAGVVIKYEPGEGWQTFAADEDMRFPTGLGVVTSGPDAGTTLISSSYGHARLHAVDDQGNVTKIRDFDGWGVLRVDQNQQIAYMATDEGRVYWASFNDLDTWTECVYEKPSGVVDSIEGLGEPNIHPQTGRMIFPAVDSDNGNTGFYEAQVENGQVVLKEVAWLSGVGQWAGKSATVNGQFYFGSGMSTGLDADLTSGAIYRLEAVSAAKTT